MEISNKTLAWLVIAAVIVSFAGTLTSLYELNSISNSGYAVSNDTATASVDVSQSVILRYAINTIDFGSGSVNTSGNYHQCVLGLNVSGPISKDGCEGFNSTGTPFVLENAGTGNLNVTLNFTENATTFLGGTPALAWFRYTVSNNESNSCVGTLSSQGWTDVVRGSVTNICTNLSWSDSSDTLKIGINISIPEDSTKGARAVSIIAQGTG